jgi:hypothetical protein
MKKNSFITLSSQVKVVYPKLKTPAFAGGLVRNATENDLAVALKRSMSTASSNDAKSPSKNPTVNKCRFYKTFFALSTDIGKRKAGGLKPGKGIRGCVFSCVQPSYE